MAAQLDYSYTTPKGVAGGKYDIAFDEVITRKNEEADGVLKYGMAAMIGTKTGSDVKVPATPAYGAKAYVVVTGKDAGTFTHTEGSNVDIGATFGNAKDDGIAVVEIRM